MNVEVVDIVQMKSLSLVFFLEVFKKIFVKEFSTVLVISRVIKNTLKYIHCEYICRKINNLKRG